MNLYEGGAGEPPHPNLYKNNIYVGGRGEQSLPFFICPYKLLAQIHQLERLARIVLQDTTVQLVQPTGRRLHAQSKVHLSLLLP